MALKLGRIPTITMTNISTDMLVDELNVRIDEINRTLYEIELENAKQTGNDTNVPKYQNNLDLNNFRVQNVTRSKDPQDVVTRRELEEIGILGSRSGSLTLSGDVVINGSLTIEGNTTGSSEVPTNTDVITIINNTIEETVPITKDGDVWDRETVTGINGSEGTVAMGVDGSGKARPIELRDGELPIQDVEVRSLLVLILEELEKFNANRGCPFG